MKGYWFLLLTFLFSELSAQETWRGSMELQGTATSKDHVPFWLRSNTYGNKPLAGISGAAIGSLYRDYDTVSNKLADWGIGAKLRFNAGNKVNAVLIEGYAKAALSIFEIKAGRFTDVMGLVGDTGLSSGAFSVSGNALGIPQVKLSVPEYFTLPILGDLFAFKGSFSHGWLGRLPLQYNLGGSTATSTITYFHQKSLYGRFGKPSWRMKLYGGFNHQAYWGNEKDIFGTNSTLSKFRSFTYVVFGKKDQESKVGNHLGSLDLGLEYEFNNTRLMVYRQSLYDVGGLYYLANIADGLNGITLTNTREQGSGLQWKKLLLEFFYTKNQGGYPWSRRTPSGDEDYYNNYIYASGWSYQSEGIGNPLITPGHYAREGLPAHPSDYFINNRIVALHAGFELGSPSLNIRGKVSYSKNYGTFGTSIYGHSTGDFYDSPVYPSFPSLSQFSGYLDVSYLSKNGLIIGATAAADAGKLYYNSAGVVIRVAKTF